MRNNKQSYKLDFVQYNIDDLVSNVKVTELNPRFSPKCIFLKELKKYLNNIDEHSENIDYLMKYEDEGNKSYDLLKDSILGKGYLNLQNIVILEYNTKKIILDGNRRISILKTLAVENKIDLSKTNLNVQVFTIGELNDMKDDDWNDIYDVCSHSHSIVNTKTKKQWSSYITNLNEILSKKNIENIPYCQLNSMSQKFILCREILISSFNSSMEFTFFKSKFNLDNKILLNQFPISTINNHLIEIIKSFDINDLIERYYSDKIIPPDYWDNYSHTIIDKEHELNKYFSWIVYLSNWTFLSNQYSQIFEDHLFPKSLSDNDKFFPLWNAQRIIDSGNMEYFQHEFKKNDLLNSSGWIDRQSHLKNLLQNRSNYKLELKEFENKSILDKSEQIFTNINSITPDKLRIYLNSTIEIDKELSHTNGSYKKLKEKLVEIKKFNNIFEKNVIFSSVNNSVESLLNLTIHHLQNKNNTHLFSACAFYARQIRENIILAAFSYLGNMSKEKQNNILNQTKNINPDFNNSIPLTKSQNYSIYHSDEENSTVIIVNKKASYDVPKIDFYVNLLLVDEKGLPNEIYNAIKIAEPLFSNAEINKLIHNSFVTETQLIGDEEKERTIQSIIIIVENYLNLLNTINTKIDTYSLQNNIVCKFV